MTEVQLPVYEPVRCCRYCLSDENDSDFVAPCFCKGSSKYVHKKCLKQWFVEKNQRVVIPAAFHQFDQCCEICHAKYKLSFKNIEPSRKLLCDIFVYILGISSLLLVFYAGVGMALQQSEKSRQLFTERGTYWENIFYNGFIMVHIILGIFYIIAIIRADTFTCYWLETGGNNDCKGEESMICCLMILIVGIIGTILMIYYDIISRVIQRHQNQSRIIEDIKEYEEL